LVDVFDEVEEELRRERYQALLRKWGPWVAGAAAAIVLGTAGYQYFTTQAQRTAERASDLYMTASALYEEGDLAGADAQFERLAEDGTRGYVTMALMRRGAIALEQGRTGEAAAFYEQAAERAPESLTRQLARYRAALALFDELSYDDLVMRLEPLTRSPAPLGPLARELMAAAALRDERWDEARRRYALLSVSLDAPQGVMRRAAEAQAYINQNAPSVEPDAAESSAVETPAQAPLQDTPADAPAAEENGL